KPERARGSRSTAQFCLVYLVDPDRVAYQTPGLFADEDLVGPRRLLETRGKIDRIARHERVFRRLGSRDYFAGVQSAASGESDSPDTFELRVVASELGSQLDGCADGAERIVLVDHRHSEDGNDGVADELL